MDLEKQAVECFYTNGFRARCNLGTSNPISVSALIFPICFAQLLPKTTPVNKEQEEEAKLAILLVSDT